MSSATALAAATLACGARKNSAPLCCAPATFCSIPPIGPTPPSQAIVPVPAILRPEVRSSGVSLVVEGKREHQPGRRPGDLAGSELDFQSSVEAVVDRLHGDTQEG